VQTKVRELVTRRVSRDASLNTPIRDDGDSGEWQDWLVDDTPSQERVLVETEDFDIRRKALVEAHGAQQPRAAHLRSAPSRRRADYAQKARGGIWSLSRAVRQIEMHAFKKVQNAARVRLRPWSGWKRRRRTGDRFQFRLPATVSGPEWPLESNNQFNGDSVIALRIWPAASAAQADGRHAKLVCACWPPGFGVHQMQIPKRSVSPSRRHSPSVQKIICRKWE
jgi:hypothetical protein